MLSDVSTERGEKVLSVSGTVDAPAAALFEILSDPARHSVIDGSSMVRKYHEGTPLREPGQIFTMDMVWTDGDTEYVMVNEVTEITESSRLAWLPAEEGSPAGGWVWSWDLAPADSPEATRVTVTCDWSGVGEELLAKKSFPVVDAAGMEASLEGLARAATQN